jgi:hypothetical protein
VLIAEFKHGIAGYAVMGFIAVTQFMGDTFLHSFNVCGVAHEEAAAGFVDRAAFGSGFLCWHSTCQ